MTSKFTNIQFCIRPYNHSLIIIAQRQQRQPPTWFLLNYINNPYPFFQIVFSHFFVYFTKKAVVDFLLNKVSSYFTISIQTLIKV